MLAGVCHQDFNSSFPLIFEGRNRKLQGLAVAILKLWEKSLIVKIALKWGVPNTNNEEMAFELKASLIENRLLGCRYVRSMTCQYLFCFLYKSVKSTYIDHSQALTIHVISK